MLEYREEIVDITGLLTDSMKLIDAFNEQYNKKEAYMFIDGNALHIMLSQLDMIKFNSFLCDHCSNGRLIKLVYETIDKIGSYGLKGSKRQFVNFNAERKVTNRKKKEQDRGKHYYANNNSFSKINVDIPDEFKNKIVCADSLETLKKLPDNCIDIIFTSPPYNFGLSYDSHNDTALWEDYFNTLFAIFREGIRVLKYGGRFVVNVQPLYSDYIPVHHIIGNFFIENKMIWKGEIIWEKNNYNCKMCSYGSWKSPSSPYLKYTWEFVEVYCKGDLKKAGNNADADITVDDFKSWVVAKWSIAPERHMKEYGHPAMFPENLVERVLKLFSFKGDTVLDPFNGAGTTTVVAKKTGRHYLGIDISKEYCDTAEKRINNMQIEQLTLFDTP